MRRSKSGNQHKKQQDANYYDEAIGNSIAGGGNTAKEAALWLTAYDKNLASKFIMRKRILSRGAHTRFPIVLETVRNRRTAKIARKRQEPSPGNPQPWVMRCVALGEEKIHVRLPGWLGWYASAEGHVGIDELERIVAEKSCR